jgi:hypothetical protein
MEKNIEMEASPSLLHRCILYPCMLLYTLPDAGQKLSKPVAGDKWNSSVLKVVFALTINTDVD